MELAILWLGAAAILSIPLTFALGALNAPQVADDMAEGLNTERNVSHDAINIPLSEQHHG